MAGKLVLHGTYGTVQGKTYLIEQGKSVVIGRSRGCDICLDVGETQTFSNSDAQHAGKHFQTISRKHLKITFHNETKVELEDLSANGTTVDGEKIDKILLCDITTESHTILLGSREKFLLEWQPGE
jgi:pSer/pThr/pTyr-binding forkhead associated (FHA) protein